MMDTKSITKMTRSGFYWLVVSTIVICLFLSLSLVFDRRKEADIPFSFMDGTVTEVRFSKTHENVTNSSWNNFTVIRDKMLKPEFRLRKETFTLPKFNGTRPIVFLHISKCGGTSFDKNMELVIRHLKGNYVGFRHFDWSHIETIPNANVVLMLREPVSRAVSHFYFKGKKYKNKHNVYYEQPLSDLVRNPEGMLETCCWWQDGMGSVGWLSGTRTADWVGIKADKVPARERRSLDITEMCLLAAKHLESVFWFGIIEALDRSLELLEYQLGLSQTIKFPKLNANRHTKVSENETRVLESLMPQDIWLYEYAKLLFEARWTSYKTGVYKHPDMPPVPSLESASCISTRAILFCKKGPLSPLYYVASNASEQVRKLPDEILDKFNHGDIAFHHDNRSDP